MRSSAAVTERAINRADAGNLRRLAYVGLRRRAKIRPPCRQGEILARSTL